MNYSKTETIEVKEIQVKNFLPELGIENVKQEIIDGLTLDRKFISPKFFYNKKGSELFEAITTLEEYYPTRTEKSILASVFDKIDIDFNALNLIELGSGDHSKIRLLLLQIPENVLENINYYPVDISQSAIEKAADNLLEEFPTLNITGITADFMHQLNILPNHGRRLICFLGSTIGNLTETEQNKFIEQLSSEMNKGDKLLIGFDMVKDIEILEKAYNDTKQVTAAFNLNVLDVVNQITNTNFNPQNFEHHAFFNAEKSRIEMHLIATIDQDVEVDSGKINISLNKGETIHTENSYKFTNNRINDLALKSKLKVETIVSDSKNWFNVVLYSK